MKSCHPCAQHLRHVVSEHCTKVFSGLPRGRWFSRGTGSAVCDGKDVFCKILNCQSKSEPKYALPSKLRSLWNSQLGTSTPPSTQVAGLAYALYPGLRLQDLVIP